MKQPIETTIIDSIKAIVENSDNEVTYSVMKEEMPPTFQYETRWERFWGITWRHVIVKKTEVKVTIIEKL
jgi:hypothetical protein